LPYFILNPKDPPPGVIGLNYLFVKLCCFKTKNGCFNADLFLREKKIYKKKHVEIVLASLIDI